MRVGFTWDHSQYSGARPVLTRYGPGADDLEMFTRIIDRCKSWRCDICGSMLLDKAAPESRW